MHAVGRPLRNFGATYITSDYRHVGRFVRAGRRIFMGEVSFWDGNDFVTILHPGNLRRLPAIGRLYWQLIGFRRRLNRLRAQVPRLCQAELLGRDPVLARAVREPAADFVRRHGLEEIDRIFAGPIVGSTVFCKTHEVNTFYFLACLMPILLPTYVADFSTALPALTAGYEGRILGEKAVLLEPEAGGVYTVATRTKIFRARHVVVATPARNTHLFCPGLDCAGAARAREISVCALYVAGRRKRTYPSGRIVFPRAGGAATVLMPAERDGTDLLFSPDAEPDLSEYYESYRVEGQVRWKTAIVLSGAEWRPLSPRKNLFTIGDHNICGLEDSFLTGLHAANRIVDGEDDAPGTADFKESCS